MSKYKNVTEIKCRFLKNKNGSVVVDSLLIVTPIVEFCYCTMFVMRFFMSNMVLQSS